MQTQQQAQQLQQLQNMQRELQSVEYQLQAARQAIRTSVHARQRAEEDNRQVRRVARRGTVLSLTIKTLYSHTLQMEVEPALTIAAFKQRLAALINRTETHTTANAKDIYLGTPRGALNIADPTASLDAMGVVDQDVLHILPLYHRLARQVAVQQAQLQEVA
uniref:Ubiquitin-like domain-containing protein n=1 Tax=Haptolina ericina TaxID=156174 RepID=A0A7S3FCB1_9EUKA|mmetsp:Transcript_63088/g.140567  ORF Transcript_63088/g.140567 Transcript_63088/m.140567 type:complete len:162 (+) Transcript_63088:324-809(+)